MPLPQRQLRLVPAVADDGWKPPSLIMYESVAHCEKLGSEGQEWARRHLMAWEFGNASADHGPKRTEAIIRDQIIAWARYGEQHRMVYRQDIGKDGVLGIGFKAIGQAIRILLQGQTGRLDQGTLDKLVLNIAESCGVNLEE